MFRAGRKIFWDRQLEQTDRCDTNTCENSSNKDRYPDVLPREDIGCFVNLGRSVFGLDGFNPGWEGGTVGVAGVDGGCGAQSA